MKLVRFAEEKLASFLGVRHALMTSWGRTALVVALKALGVSLGDEVILPSFHCNILIKCIEFCRARPVFADVDPLTFNIDPEEIKNSITRNTKAILVIHCYGQPADMNEILDIAKKNDISVIEDVAHSLGAEYHGEKVGGLGDFSMFSFSKNMGCSTGGALATNSDNLMSNAKEVLDDFSASETAITRLRYSARHKLFGAGRSGRFLLSSLGLLRRARKFTDSATDRVPALFSANDKIAVEVIEGLKSIGQKNRTRRKKARVLTEMVNDLKIDDVSPPFEKEDRTHVFYIYGLKVNEREKIVKGLRKIEKYTFWSLPWQCPYAHTAKELSNQLITFEMNYVNEKGMGLVVSTLSNASKNQFNSAS